MAKRHDTFDGDQPSWPGDSASPNESAPPLPPMPPGLPGGHLPPTTPKFTAENTPCLRGPCRYYWEVWTHFEHGNARDTPGLGEPRERSASCMRHPGVEMQITADAPVLACNQWSPADQENA